MTIMSYSEEGLVVKLVPSTIKASCLLQENLQGSDFCREVSVGEFGLLKKIIQGKYFSPDSFNYIKQIIYCNCLARNIFIVRNNLMHINMLSSKAVISQTQLSILFSSHRWWMKMKGDGPLQSELRAVWGLIWQPGSSFQSSSRTLWSPVCTFCPPSKVPPSWRSRETQRVAIFIKLR